MEPKTPVEEPQDKEQPSAYELFMRDRKNILKQQREGEKRKGADEESE